MYFLKDFVGDLATALIECTDEKFVVECLGILGNLSLTDLDYSEILHTCNLLPWIRNILVPGIYYLLIWCKQTNVELKLSSKKEKLPMTLYWTR